MTAANFFIDGQSINLKSGKTIMDVACELGIEIPSLCHIPALKPQGNCRLCLVKLSRKDTPVLACNTRAEHGMSIEIDTPELVETRKQILALYLSYLDESKLWSFDGGGIQAKAFIGLLKRYPPDVKFEIETAISKKSRFNDSHPYLRFEPDRCINCRRCVQVCEDVQGQFVFSVLNRGHESILAIGENDSFTESDCTACGACVDVCPTGALFDLDRKQAVSGKDLTVTNSVCGYCGVGCNIKVTVANDRILRIDASNKSPVNRGYLCAKGRFAHQYVQSTDRLTHPLLKEPDGWRKLSWPEALSWVTQRLLAIKEESGPDALGVFTSSRSTNEAAYLLQKVFRAVIGTNNVDCCARVCHSSTALGLRLATGAGAATASYADIEKAGLIVVAGANPTEAHPIVGARIKQAVRSGARLLVIDPRRIELAQYADVHLQLNPGTNVVMFNGLANAMLVAGDIARSYLSTYTEGLEDLTEHVRNYDPDFVAKTCAVDIDGIRQAANLLGRHKPVLFVHGLGLSELTQGVGSVMALANLGMLTGSIGRAGGGMLPLRGQNNVQGNADMGSMPNLLPGYQSLQDPAVLRKFEALWAVTLPKNPGLTIPEMIDAAHGGNIRGLWIQGEDVAQSDPNQRHVIEALKRLDLLVVQELFMSETAKLAHLVLPAAGALEQDGTFTNGERRIQRVRQALSPPGEAKPDWQVASQLASQLGASWTYEHPANVMEEIAEVASHFFGGVRYPRLKGQGLQWPCPSLDHDGTETVHKEGFLAGVGHLTCVDYVPSPEVTSDEFPLVLITGRVLQQYNVGTMTRRTGNQQLHPADFLSLNGTDVDNFGLTAGRPVRVRSRYGEIQAKLQVSESIKPGTAFLSFHYPETHTNLLTGPHRDPQSNCPEYKLTAIAVMDEPQIHEPS